MPWHSNWNKKKKLVHFRGIDRSYLLDRAQMKLSTASLQSRKSNFNCLQFPSTSFTIQTWNDGFTAAPVPREIEWVKARGSSTWWLHPRPSLEYLKVTEAQESQFSFNTWSQGDWNLQASSKGDTPIWPFSWEESFRVGREPLYFPEYQSTSQHSLLIQTMVQMLCQCLCFYSVDLEKACTSMNITFSIWKNRIRNIPQSECESSMF